MTPDPPDSLVPSPEDRLSQREDHELRSFTVAEGILMLVLGLLALIFPLVASLWVTAVVAMVFLVAGLISGLNTLCRARQLAGFHTFWRLVVSTLLVVSGIWMVTRLASGPIAAAGQVAALALAVAVVFLVEGTVASMVSLSNRHVDGWGWGLLNGVVTLGLGILIVLLKSIALQGVLGSLVGISFLLSGLDLLTFSASFHQARRAQ